MMAPVPPAPRAPEPQAWLPEGIGEAALLAELRRLSWGAAAILRAYGRGEQPPYGFAPVLSVEEGGEEWRAQERALLAAAGGSGSGGGGGDVLRAALDALADEAVVRWNAQEGCVDDLTIALAQIG